MPYSSQENLKHYKTTCEKTQYQITNLSLLIASTIYILAIIIALGLSYNSIGMLGSLRFRLQCVLCVSVIAVDILFYFMDSTSKSLKYIITTWYSIFYLIALFTIQNTVIFYSIIFLLVISIMYINMHLAFFSCSCIFLCTVSNTIYRIISAKELYTASINNYYIFNLYIFISSCIIIIITYMLSSLRNNVIDIFVEIFSANENDKTDIKSQTHNLKKKVRKTKKNIDYLENTMASCNKTTTEISNISRVVSKHNRTLSNLSQNLKKSCEHSDNLLKEANTSRDNISQFINNHMRNVKHLESHITGTNNALDTAKRKLIALEKSHSKLQTVLKNISSLSSQLNLLTLNVSIESINNDSDEAGFKVALEQLRTLTDNIQTTTDTLSDFFSDIEHYTNIISLLFESATDSYEEKNKLIALIKNDTTSVISDLDILLGIITNLSCEIEQKTSYSDDILAATSELTPAITSIRSIAIENSTSGQKVYDTLADTKITINDILENISDINNIFFKKIKHD